MASAMHLFVSMDDMAYRSVAYRGGRFFFRKRISRELRQANRGCCGWISASRRHERLC
jgi:hypothetical protein